MVSENSNIELSAASSLFSLAYSIVSANIIFSFIISFPFDPTTWCWELRISEASGSRNAEATPFLHVQLWSMQPLHSTPGAHRTLHTEAIGWP